MDKMFFNATQKEVESKKYNIFMGVSLGTSKSLIEKEVEDCMKWAVKNAKNKVIVLIADEIAKFNYNVFSGYNKDKSRRRAIREGDKYVDFFNKIIDRLSKYEQDKIQIVRWKDIWDKEKERIKLLLEKEYGSNKEFRERVRFFVKKHAEKRNKVLDEVGLDCLSQYIFYELSTLFDGIEYENEKYGILLYPTFKSSGMSEFVVEVENSEKFYELRKKMDLSDRVIMVEAYLKSF